MFFEDKRISLVFDVSHEVNFHLSSFQVDTLRHAVEYIQSLQRMLNRHGSEDDTDSYSTTSNSEPVTELVKVESFDTPTTPEPEPPAVSTPQTPMEAYDSGHETSSYYSNHSLISPVPYQTQYNMGYTTNAPPQHCDYQVSSTSQLHSLDSVTSTVIPPIRTFNYYNHHTPTLGLEPTSEEDELLDAIANWQDAQ